ncbi:ribose 5-phosphate isomerase A [Pedobacter sp. SD-b]|uniref:Ribose 5-phosphate isomerase A n=1 Tax=Pedobacter segetis TaxID=2793069 RepID=A0ABS1BNM5_9SPHI|nr:ribose 5-phosphate isomerase A [Pedobacter segetis]MBK0383921.1 ribose 5-phosphate isomerase A [Pedobacter segetis]
MEDYKLEAAKASLGFISEGQKLGLGAGSSIFYLIDIITKNEVLSQSLSFVSSSFKTRQYLCEKGLKSSSNIENLAIYFDGCDQFDIKLNAFKSGGGIHTSEKIMASIAKEFILVGDESKFVEKLDHTHPLVVEVLPEALFLVLKKIQANYPECVATVRMANQKDGAVITENGNLLIDIRFQTIPDLAELNIKVKMIPGIIEHSLFYGLATKAIIAGKQGIRIIKPSYERAKI